MNTKKCTKDEALEHFGFFEAGCESIVEEGECGETVFLTNSRFPLGSWKKGILIF